LWEIKRRPISLPAACDYEGRRGDRPDHCAVPPQRNPHAIRHVRQGTRLIAFTEGHYNGAVFEAT
jgi:hypothetical protein